MSDNAKAIIFYGIDFWNQEKDDEPPAYLVDGDVISRADIGPEEWLLAADGIEVERLTDEEIEALREALPVELVTYQHYAVPSFALAVKGTVTEANQFQVKPVPTGVDRGVVWTAEQEAMTWCADRGIDFEPKWRFTSYLGD